MKTALTAILALGLTVTGGCRSFSSNSIFSPRNSCSSGCGVDCYEKQANHLWEAGSPGGMGCEGEGCSAGSGCVASCGLESTSCVPGCGVESVVGCAGCSGNDASCGLESTGCAVTAPNCAAESTAIVTGCSGGCASRTARRRLAPIVNASDFVRGGPVTATITDDGLAAGCESIQGRQGVALAGRLGANGGAFGEGGSGNMCPNCGGLAGLAGCRACGFGMRAVGLGQGMTAHAAAAIANRPHMQNFLQNTATACAGGHCGMSPGPEQGSVMYPYYTLRGPRDFLMSNPPSIGP